MVVNNCVTSEQGNGNPEVFDAEWREALIGGDPRWLSYPSAHALTQTELFEWVKAEQIERILELHNLTTGRVLEYACGSAGMSAYLANRGFDVIATDLSINALRLARRNSVLRSVPEDHFAASIGNVFHLPFTNNSFDVVMSYGLLEHFTEEALVSLLSETNRVLRPGGLHIVDIIHGRLSIRTLATMLNFSASACSQIVRGRANRVPEIYKSYYEHYYENTFRPPDWARLFQASGLREVTIHSCRPFPLLAIGGIAERLYIATLKALLPLWQWFDRTDVPGVNTFGWMYLVYGIKDRE